MNKNFYIGLLIVGLVIGGVFLIPRLTNDRSFNTRVPVYEPSSTQNAPVNYMNLYGNFSMLYRVGDDLYVYQSQDITGSVYFNGTEIDDLGFRIILGGSLDQGLSIDWKVNVSLYALNITGDYMLAGVDPGFSSDYTFSKDKVGFSDSFTGKFNENRTSGLMVPDDYISLSSVLFNGEAEYTDINTYLMKFIAGNDSLDVVSFHFQCVIAFSYEFKAYSNNILVSNSTQTFLYELELSSENEEGNQVVASVFFEPLNLGIDMDVIISAGLVGVGGIAVLYFIYGKSKKTNKRRKRRKRK